MEGLLNIAMVYCSETDTDAAALRVAVGFHEDNYKDVLGAE